MSQVNLDKNGIELKSNKIYNNRQYAHHIFNHAIRSFSMFTSLIIILVLMLAVIFGGYLLFEHIRHTIKRYTANLVDIEHLDKLAKELEQDGATRPKSVSAMTSVYLPQISKDFPGFNYNEMKGRAETVLASYLKGITQMSTEPLTDGNSELKYALETYINSLKEQEIKETFKAVKIHRTEISNYSKTPGKCVITFQSSLQCIHYKERYDELKEGSKDLTYQTKYDIDMIYIQDRDKLEEDMDSARAYNCPNCGAPIRSLKYKSCEYCGCSIEEYNIKVWSFSSVRERTK